MQSAKYRIKVGEEQIDLLFTPFVGSEAQRRGITLSVEDKSDAGQVMELLAKLIYLSALNARTVAQFDNPDLGELSLSYTDIHIWAWSHQEEVMRISKRMLANIFNMPGAADEDVKKK